MEETKKGINGKRNDEGNEKGSKEKRGDGSKIDSRSVDLLANLYCLILRVPHTHTHNIKPRQVQGLKCLAGPRSDELE